jgi:predicted nucleotidyltransferase component of viral defense system
MIIKDIFRSKLWKHLAFKGWTACYFLYWLDRFSTDLDFDIYKDSGSIDEDIIDIVKKYGQVKKWNKMVLSYGESDINIKIDINRHIRKNNTYQRVNFYGTDIRVQDKASIFANKLVALTERNTNRDIYDVYFFYKQMFDINEAIIQERTGKTIKELLKQIKQKLEKLPTKYKILDGLGELLDEKQKHFVKNHLLQDLMSIIELQTHF